MTGIELVVLVVVGSALAVPAIGLLRAGQAPWSAGLLLAAGLLLGGEAAAGGTGHGALAGTLEDLAWYLAGPLALVVHPWPRVAEAAGFLAVVAVLGIGGIGVLAPSPPEATASALLLVLGGHLWWRLEHSRGAQRRAVTWLALGGGAAAATAVVLAFVVVGEGPAGPWAAAPFVVLGPVANIGVTRSSLVDAPALVVAVVAHAATLTAVFAVLVGAGAALLPGVTSGRLAVLALLTAALSATYHPVHRVLRGTATAVLLGEQPDPVRAVGLVARRVGDAPEDALRAVRRALALPWAAIPGNPPVVSGQRPDVVVRVPLGDGLPDLEVGLRSDAVQLNRVEEQVLGLAAPLLGQSLRLHALARALQDARQQVVLGREEERRRLRRDLHDGLGPLLAGLGMTADAAANLLPRDVDAARARLADVRAQAGAALADVRRVVYGMRPPALDELGLVPALRQAVVEVVGPGPAVAVEAPEGLVVPAAVEVAAYRIVVEAVVNAVRHGHASHVDVRLERDGDLLQVEVADDGTAGSGWVPGVGLQSMTERAAELGGTLRAGPTGRGGRVAALLPTTPGWSSVPGGGASDDQHERGQHPHHADGDADLDERRDVDEQRR